MKIVDLSNTYGNFSNHLYFCLMMFNLESKSNEQFKYIRNGDFEKFNLFERLKRFNLDRFSIDRILINPNDQILKNIDHPTRRYHQVFNIDFILLNVENFISKYIIPSETFRNANPQEDDSTCAIHIRCGDYIGSSYDCFDRISYIKNALRCFSNIYNILIFTDDKEYVQTHYMSAFDSNYSITFSNNTSADDDFRDLSLYKNKILWNSTFSFWSAFIGNVIYKDSYESVIAPSKFDNYEPLCNHVNPLWRIINVK